MVVLCLAGQCQNIILNNQTNFAPSEFPRLKSVMWKMDWSAILCNLELFLKNFLFTSDQPIVTLCLVSKESHCKTSNPQLTKSGRGIVWKISCTGEKFFSSPWVRGEQDATTITLVANYKSYWSIILGHTWKQFYSFGFQRGIREIDKFCKDWSWLRYGLACDLSQNFNKKSVGKTWQTTWYLSLFSLKTYKQDAGVVTRRMGHEEDGAREVCRLISNSILCHPRAGL